MGQATAVPMAAIVLVLTAASAAAYVLAGTHRARQPATSASTD